MSAESLAFATSHARKQRIGQFLIAAGIAFTYVCLLAGCNDASSVTTPAPDPGPGALTIVTSSLPTGTTNLPYATTVGGSGGTTPYSWSVSPALPATLSLDQATGAITGTPNVEGTTTHTFTLTDSSAPPQSIQKVLALTISSAPPVLSITTTSLPNGNVGQTYNQPVVATGGTPPFSWSITVGSLPQNLTLNPTTGVISGLPTAIGTSQFTVQVLDSAGQADTQPLQIVINPSTPPNITTTSPLPGGTVGVPYSETLQATGGTGALVWSRIAGSLPTNLTLSSAGVISGTPTNTGTSNFTVQVRDALSQADSQAFSMTVATAVTITTTSLSSCRINRSCSRTLSAAGGITPYTWSLAPGSAPLPPGLTLSTGGVISGTPTSLGTFSPTFRVQDSGGRSATKQLSLTITL